MYASHNLLIIYIFLPIADNKVVSLMGVLASICYTFVMIFVSYKDDEHQVIRVMSEVLFLLCCNFLGNFFRVMNEIDIRRNLLERREVVQKNLSLKFERNQEKELLFSILPEHIAEKMQKDIKAMVEKKLKLQDQSKK
jgi:adenylate cyclase